MKIVVLHDVDGNINSFGIPNQELAGPIGLQPPPGEYAAEVEVQEIQGFKGDTEQEYVRVLDILQKSRIDTAGGQPRLARK